MSRYKRGTLKWHRLIGYRLLCAYHDLYCIALIYSSDEFSTMKGFSIAKNTRNCCHFFVLTIETAAVCVVCGLSQSVIESIIICCANTKTFAECNAPTFPPPSINRCNRTKSKFISAYDKKRINFSIDIKSIFRSNNKKTNCYGLSIHRNCSKYTLWEEKIPCNDENCKLFISLLVLRLFAYESDVMRCVLIHVHTPLRIVDDGESDNNDLVGNILGNAQYIYLQFFSSSNK